jgi:hypothetical protein
MQRKRVNFARVECWIIRVSAIMAAANCGPVVASRRAKYVGDFRVPTLLGAQPLDAQLFPDGFSRLDPAVPEKGGLSPVTRSQKFNFSPAAISAESSL